MFVFSCVVTVAMVIGMVTVIIITMVISIDALHVTAATGWGKRLTDDAVLKVKVKVYICRVHIPKGSSDFTSMTPRYCNSLFHIHLFSGENAAHFLQLKPYITNFLFHLVPITAWWLEAMWIQSLSKALHLTAVCGKQTPDPFISGPTPWPLSIHEYSKC